MSRCALYAVRRSNPGSGTTMPTKAADLVSDLTRQLERSILSGEYALGQRLPAERKLCEQLGVSRSVVREAIGRLTSAGLVQSRHGSGTRVTRPSSQQVAAGYKRLLGTSAKRLADLAVVRLSLETTMASLAAQHRKDEHLDRLRKTQKVLGNLRKPLAARAAPTLNFMRSWPRPLAMWSFHLSCADSRSVSGSSPQDAGRIRLGTGSSTPHADPRRGRTPDALAAMDAMREHLAVNSQHLRELLRRELSIRTNKPK